MLCDVSHRTKAPTTRRDPFEADGDRPPPSAYHPAALADRLDGYVDYAESYYLVEDRNLFTSILNSGVSTLAEVARSSTDVLRVGVNTARGVEQIENAQDGWDVAIGLLRIASDAGQVASAAASVAGAAAGFSKLLRRGQSPLICTTQELKHLADGRVMTEPTLPSRVIAEQGDVRIEHHYRSDDHEPAHLHVSGGGEETRIGQNGKPLHGQPELTRTQRSVVRAHKGEIRRSVDKIGRWLRFRSL
jgi:hypothetical protein